MYLRVWDIRTGRALVEAKIDPNGEDSSGSENRMGLPVRNEGILSPDASKILLTTREGSFLFDATTGEQIRPVASGKIESACFTQDSSRLLMVRAASKPARTPLRDGGVRISAPRRHEIVMLNLDDDSVIWSFAINGRDGPIGVSDDGRLVAVSEKGDKEHTVYFLDGTTGQELGTIPNVGRLGWGSNGLQMAFSPDLQRFAACLLDSTVLVWKLANLGIQPRN